MASLTTAEVVLVGESDAAAVRATDVEALGRGRYGFTLHLPGAAACPSGSTPPDGTRSATRYSPLPWRRTLGIPLAGSPPHSAI